MHARSTRRTALSLFTLAVVLGLSSQALAAMNFSGATVTGVTTTGVTALETDVNSTSGVVYTATFDFGPTNAYGTVVPGTTGINNVPALFNGTISSVPITGLTCGTTYHYRINVAAAGTDVDNTFTTSACSASVPTVSEWGMIILGVLFAGALVVSARRGQVGAGP